MSEDAALTRLNELIERLEKAAGPDRELDAVIWLAVVPGARRKATTVNHHAGPYVIDETRDATGRLITVPSYTGSIDAAVSLAPEGWDNLQIHRSNSQYYAIVARGINTITFPIAARRHAQGATKPLAIVIASLRARMGGGI